MPLPNVGAALDEIAYALDVLKLDGVGLLASYNGVFLGDPLFDPILAELDRRATTVLIHPALPPTSRSLSTDYPGFMAEFAIDTTRAVTHMIFTGTVEKFPNVKFILSHAGGAIPFLSFRLSMAPLIDRTRFGHRTPEWVMHQIGQPISTPRSPPARKPSARSMSSPTRIINLFGSDWPYCPDAVAERCTAGLNATLSPTRLAAAVERDNALKLFPRFG